MAKKMTNIESSSADPSGRYKTFDPDILNMAQNLGGPPLLAGQDISSSPKGNIYTGDVDMKDGPKHGDVIHGANKYKDEKGMVEDKDFEYKESTRESSQGDSVAHWSITGVK